MNHKTKYKLAAAGVTSATLATALNSTVVMADCPVGSVQDGANCSHAASQPSSLTDQIVKITDVLLWVVGIAAVIMLIVGGFQYIFSSGDSAKTATAKNTILFSIIGIVVAILAYAIVTFVTSQFS